MFFYVLFLPQKPSPPYAALSRGFLLDVLVTLFLLLALRLCMIVVYDLIKLKQSRRANSRQVLVYGTGTSLCLWSRVFKTRRITASSVF